MATKAEVEAAAKRAEAAGDTEAAAELRAYAQSLPAETPQYTPEQIKAATEAARAAGDLEAVAELESFAQTLPAIEVAPVTQAAPDMAAPGAEQPPVADATPQASLPADVPFADLDLSMETFQANQADDLARFEAANPALRGKFKPGDKLPDPGTPYDDPNNPAMTDPMTGFAGNPQSAYVVDWRVTETPEGGFGDTAATMMEGPWSAVKAFGGGLVGGPSPSRERLQNDPAFGKLPSFVNAGLGFIGDLGGAALSTVGTGMAGATGLLAEAVPGQSASGERKFGRDVIDMTMFAVPELAGVSSVGMMGASAVPRAVEGVAPKVGNAADIAADVAAAEKVNIPVMRTDMFPPETSLGKVAQKGGESIPFVGTGGLRSKQQAARLEATKNFATEYGADGLASAVDDVAADLLAKRADDLDRLVKQKTDVITRLDDAGEVPTPGAAAAIDKQIAALEAQKMSSLGPVIAKLKEFKESLSGQTLEQIEANRKVIGEAFADPSLASIRGAGEKALSAVYGPLREDMANFIKQNGKPEDFNAWSTANADLAAMAGDLKNTTLKRVLEKGEMTPETVRSLLFSTKASDINKLYENLTPQGQAAARTAIIQEVIAKAGGVEGLSPDRFATAMGKMGKQIGTFFKGDDLEAANGLVRALDLTRRAQTASAAPLTGAQNLPAILGVLAGVATGTVSGSAAALGGIGIAARLYERSGVKKLLREMSRAETPKERATVLKKMGEAFKDIAIPAAANNDTPPSDYEALYGRY